MSLENGWNHHAAADRLISQYLLILYCFILGGMYIEEMFSDPQLKKDVSWAADSLHSCMYNSRAMNVLCDFSFWATAIAYVRINTGNSWFPDFESKYSMLDNIGKATSGDQKSHFVKLNIVSQLLNAWHVKRFMTEDFRFLHAPKYLSMTSTNNSFSMLT